MKSAMLLATALFLASAPSPDSKSISEMSAGFMAPQETQGLMAAESVTEKQPGTETSSQAITHGTDEKTEEATEAAATSGQQ